MGVATPGTVADLCERLCAHMVSAHTAPEQPYRAACVSATISEALRDAVPGCALVVPLGNMQVVRAAALLGAAAVVACGGCEVDPQATAEADRAGLPVLATALDLETCRRRLESAAAAAVTPARAHPASSRDPSQSAATFPVLGGGYFMAGEASRRVRQTLEAAGLDAELVRRVSIATYEAEMNVVIYAPSGSASVALTPDEVEVCVSDNGPGIADLDLAMRPGYSTAPPKARTMGFGAGMGLPNISRCCDEVSFERDPGGGMRVTMRFLRRRKNGGAS